MNRTNQWTPDQEQRLLEICVHTHRIGDIAALLEPIRANVSRNAIIGKIQRMRARGHQITTGPSSRTYPDPDKPRKLRNTPQSFARVEISRVSTQPKQPPPPEVVPFTMRLISLMELGDRTCRWPIGDEAPFLFCGNPTDPERVYCPVHHVLAHGR